MVMVYMATAVNWYASNSDDEWTAQYGSENYEERFENQPKIQEMIEKCLSEETGERADAIWLGAFATAEFGN